MNFSVNRKTFSAALSVAAGIANRKSTRPILANVLLRVVDSKRLTLAASDLSITLVTDLECDATAEGIIALPAARLAEIVSAMRGDDVTVSLKDMLVEVKSAKAKFTVAGFHPRDFPNLPTAPKDFAEVDASALADLLTRAAHAVCTDTTRAHMNGINLKCAAGRLRVEATDGHRCVVAERDGESKFKSKGITLPIGILKDLGKILGGEQMAEMAAGQAHVYVRAGSTLACMNKVDLVFPPVDQVIPKESAYSGTAPREQLLETIKRVAIVAEKGDLKHAVDMSFAAGVVTITAESAEGGSGEESMGIEWGGDPLTVRVSAKYLAEALASIDGEEVFIGTNGQADPFVIRSTDGDHTCIVMPQRVT